MRPSISTIILLITDLLPIRNGKIINIDIDLVPVVTRRRHGEQPCEDVVHPTGNDHAGEVVDVVDILRADGNVPADGAGEADYVDQDAGEVGGVGAPGESVAEEIGVCFAGAVQGFDVQVAAADYVVVADHDAGNGGEEEGVC